MTKTVKINGREAVIMSTDGKTWVTDLRDVMRFEARRQERYAAARRSVNAYVGAHSPLSKGKEKP